MSDLAEKSRAQEAAARELLRICPHMSIRHSFFKILEPTYDRDLLLCPLLGPGVGEGVEGSGGMQGTAEREAARVVAGAALGPLALEL